MIEEEVAARILANVVLMRTSLRIASEDFFREKPSLAYMKPVVRKLGYGVARNYMLLDQILTRYLDYRLPANIIKLMLARILIYEAIKGKLRKRRISKLVEKLGIRKEDILGLEDVKVDEFITDFHGIDRLSIKYSIPRWILEEILPLGVPRLEMLLKELNSDPKYRWIRVAPWTTREEVIEELEEEGIKARKDEALSDTVMVYEGINKLSRTRGYLEGKFIIQDRASILVGHIASPQATKFLDITAGVGIKATHAAWLGAYYVLASDIKPKRVVQAKQAAPRLKVAHVMDFIVADGRTPPFRRADVILVDPPCTDLGRLQYEPEIRMWLNRGDAKFYRRLQYKLLRSVASHADKNTIIVYSVCTFTYSETIWVLKRVLKTELYLEINEATPVIGIKPRELPEAQLLLPHISLSQGFFIAKLRKN